MLSAGFELTRQVALYLRQKLKSRRASQPFEVSVPAGWSIHLLVDCNWAIEVISTALLNQRKSADVLFLSFGSPLPDAVKWNVQRYGDYLTPGCTGANVPSEESLLRRFPPLHLPGVQNEPLVVIDSAGNILAWYLPKLLSPQRRVICHVTV